MKLYHVATDLEYLFNSVDEALCYFQGGLAPRVPVTAGVGEDSKTPRVCLAPSVEQCLSAIKLTGIFRRCLAANEDAKSYATKGNEVYPVLILEFQLDDGILHFPTKDEVPDVEITGEVWAMRHVKPTSIQCVWLHPFSILWKETHDGFLNYACESVEFAESVEGRDHPWLNGKGNILDSSELEYDYGD